MLQKLRSGGVYAAVIAVMVVVIGLVVFGEHQATALKTPMLVLTRPVAVGSRVTSNDVKVLDVALAGQSVQFLTSLPANAVAVVPLQPGQVLVGNELTTQNYAEISIAIKNGPQVAVGDTCDLYLNTAASSTGNNGATVTSTTTNLPASTTLLGVGLPIVAVNGNNLTIQVPFRSVTDWAAVSGDTPQLVLVVASTNGPPSSPSVNLPAALSTLEAEAAAGVSAKG